jgi:hypothetical protein
MKPAELKRARLELGLSYGLDRPLHRIELGELLGLGGRNPGNTVSVWESGKQEITGPSKVAILAMLDGWRPHHLRTVIREERKQENGNHEGKESNEQSGSNDR